MYQSTHGYDSIETPLKKDDNKGGLARGLFWGFSAAALFVLSVLFVYSGYFGTETPLHAFFVSNEPQNVRIEYQMNDERAIDLEPNTEEWIAFHDTLITEAGFDAAALRSNPSATVSFVAYDIEDVEEDIVADEDVEEEMRNRGGNYYRQSRPTYGISCYYEYTEVGTTNSQMCNPTNMIANPIRTGCSSLGKTDSLSGVTAVGEFECASSSAVDRVSARCCQPTPTTKYESSAWTMSMREKNEEEACLDIGCHDGEVLTGCSGAVEKTNVFGGVKMFKNECSVQKDSTDGELVANAMCAMQAGDADYTLQCQTVNADSAMKMKRKAEFGYMSYVQCPVNTVMFDCNSYLEDKIGECDGSASAQVGALSGEYYFKKMKKSKTYCKAVGSSDQIRAQGVCCGLF